jgi:dipeptidyl aminopeptidase/acylaminoacyl peptidase
LDFWWASPNRVLYDEAEHDWGWDKPIPTGELYAVNADGSGSDMLYGYRMAGVQTGSHIQQVTAENGSADFLSRIAGDPDHVLVEITDWDATGSLARFTTVWKMDVRDGRKQKVATAPMREASYLADHKGNVRFAWADDTNGDHKVYMRPADGGDWELLPEVSTDRDTPLAFSADDSVVWLECPVVERGFGVCRFDPATKKFTHVWHNADVEMDELVQGLAQGSVMGVRFVDGRPTISVFDAHSPDTKALIALMQQYPGEDAQFVSGTDDGSKAIAVVQADVDPGAFFLYDRASNKFAPILQRAPWIDPNRMARKIPITVTARDGLKLQGYVSYPPSKENAKHLPMVVFVHGGPFGIRDDWEYDYYVQAMATRGYAVLQVNYRGSGGYGYGFMEAGFHEWGGKMQDDVTDATRWAIAQGIADPNRICIYGISYGGYAALEGAVKEPDLYKCAIGYAGVYDLPKMIGRTDEWVLHYDSEFWKRTVGTDPTVLEQHSPIYQLGNLKAKVMLVVGGKDKIVLPEQGKDLHAALLARHVPHEWLYMPDEWHGFYDEDHVAEVLEKVDAFLDANIGPGAGGSTTTTAAAH